MHKEEAGCRDQHDEDGRLGALEPVPGRERRLVLPATAPHAPDAHEDPQPRIPLWRRRCRLGHFGRRLLVRTPALHSTQEYNRSGSSLRSLSYLADGGHGMVEAVLDTGVSPRLVEYMTCSEPKLVSNKVLLEESTQI